MKVQEAMEITQEFQESRKVMLDAVARFEAARRAYLALPLSFEKSDSRE